LDEELDRFKRINLPEYAASRGYRLIGREPTRSGGSRGSTNASILMRHPGTDDKVVIRLDADGHWTYFSVRDDRDNGTIIDFLERRGAPGLAALREELRAWSGREAISPRPQPFSRRASTPPPHREAVRDVYARARVSPNHPYLNSRGIRPETLSGERFAGTWRVDDRGNLLFPHRDGPRPEDLCGFEKKSACFAGFVAGGTKTLWMSNAEAADRTLIVTEAVLDAFSYHQIHQDPHARFASTGGSLGERQARHVACAIAALPPGSLVVTATDGDDAGEKLAARIASLAGETPVARHRPPIGKDWNEYLQRHECDYIRSLGLRAPGLER
jgi:hypothetical protein